MIFVVQQISGFVLYLASGLGGPGMPVPLRFCVHRRENRIDNLKPIDIRKSLVTHLFQVCYGDEGSGVVELPTLILAGL